jgi:hypothetical protein
LEVGCEEVGCVAFLLVSPLDGFGLYFRQFYVLTEKFIVANNVGIHSALKCELLEIRLCGA